ncbi:hypothetical protein [Vibrio gigantis]|nr:hypothetical protein [Vibrio gigantis]
MNKTILATLITTVFSSNVMAQSVDTGSHTEQSGVAYEQDDSSAWKAVGGGALALTAAVLSGSSSSSSNDSSGLPEADNGPIKDKPVLPEWEGETKLETVEINGTTYLKGFITGAGEDARHVDIVGFGKDGNNAIYLNGSEGNDVRVIMHEGEVAELRVNGQVITKEYLNGKDRLPVIDNSPILPEVDNGPIKDKPVLPEWEGETKLETVEINGTTYLKGFITGAGEDARHVDIVGFGKDGNNAIYLNGSEGNDIRVIMHEGEAVELRINGQVVTKDYLNGKEHLPVVGNGPILPEFDGGKGAKELVKNIDRTKLQNIKAKVMNKLAK